MKRNGDKLQQTISIVFVKEYVHYRTGKLMIAEEYGYKAWPLRIRRRKK